MALHYILDGYNIIKKTPHLKDKKLRCARTALIEFIEIHRPHGSRRNQITLVFDGSSEVFYDCECSYETKIVFTKNETADDYIKHYVDNSRFPKSICIVTDDRDVRLYCRSSRAIIMNVAEFMKKKLENKRKNSRNEIDQKVSPGDSLRITDELKSLWLK